MHDIFLIKNIMHDFWCDALLKYNELFLIYSNKKNEIFFKGSNNLDLEGFVLFSHNHAMYGKF